MIWLNGQKWHPDRCSASGNVKFVEEAKKKFQAIQEAYSGNYNSELINNYFYVEYWLIIYLFIFYSKLKKSWIFICIYTLGLKM